MLCMISRPAKKRMNQKQLNILRSLQVTKRIHRCCHGKSILPHPLGKPEDGPGREEGSATVEAALVIPVFFASLCSLIMLGQFLLVEAEIQYTLSQTARICARREGARKWENREKETYGGEAVTSVRAATIFYSLMDRSSLNGACIRGGKTGILVALTPKSGDILQLEARYHLKLSLPFLRPVSLPRKLRICQRAYGGFVPHEGQEEAYDPTVYITDNREVYHTRLSCTHICLTIRDAGTIKSIMAASRYSACEKCIGKGKIPAQLYVTPYGDCYHASLSCSGLKRSIHAVKLSQVAGLRQCSRCAVTSH